MQRLDVQPCKSSIVPPFEMPSRNINVPHLSAPAQRAGCTACFLDAKPSCYCRPSQANHTACYRVKLCVVTLQMLCC
jgi:hypothetical protein